MCVKDKEKEQRKKELSKQRKSNKVTMRKIREQLAKDLETEFEELKEVVAWKIA